MKRMINIPIFVSHQGCPNDCVFCNQKRITGVRAEETKTEIQRKIECFLATCQGKQAEKEIAYFGGSFTGIEAEKQMMYLQLAEPYIRRGEVKGIRISTRPDYINSGICERLYRHHVTTVELGVQSLDDEVLLMNRRGMRAAAVEEAVSYLRQYPFSIGMQMMTGMLGSDAKRDIATAEKLIRLQPDFVRIYPTVVLKDTALQKLYHQGQYRPMDLEDSIKLSAKLLDMFEDAGIPVIRLGLMAGEEVNEKEVVGPYHSAYRELVESYRIRQKIEQKLQGKQTAGKLLVITCPPAMVSKVIGNRKQNFLFLQKKYGLQIRIEQSSQVEELEIEIK